MRRPLPMPHLIMAALLAGCAGAQYGESVDLDPRAFEDLTKTKAATLGQVYRMGETGICGTVESDHILVTHIVPGSVADGKIQKGDLVRGMQHRGMGGWGGIPNLVRVRLYRIGRDWDWHFFVTVERPSLRGGKGNTLTYDLHVPPAPGNICHYGPTGFFAERSPDHLVVDVVEKGSPSDGKLKKGDVILAVDGKPITVDAYNLFTRAIDKAESLAGKGLLELRVRRTGVLPPGSTATVAPKKKSKAAPEPPPQTEPEEVSELDVLLKLKVLGSYSATAPVDCRKTDALIAQTADHIVKSRDFGRLNWGLLGLLATGEEKYIKVVRDYLHAAPWAQPDQDLDKLIAKGTGGYTSWPWGYQEMLLAEYYLLTGDKFVLPAITKYARVLAAGQDQAGLWGHRMHHPDNGRAFGYGVMNQPSLSIFVSLILAQKCGVDDPVVRAAIKTTHDHYDKWVGHGALPYGNHGPMQHMFTNNGTSGSLAVALALLGNRRGARFYGAMSAAATEEILLGHGGPSWNILWSGLGANVLGPEMATAYNNKIHWLRTVTRTWSGAHVGMLGWGSTPGSGSFGSTGSHLLNLCTGRRKIHITGKGMDSSLWVKAPRAKEIVEAGTIDRSSDDALLALLGSPYPPVRVRAAQALAMRDAQVAEEVMALLKDGNANQRVGAIHAIQNLKIEPVVDELLAIATNEKGDLWVRQVAVSALGGMAEAKKYAPRLLEMLVRDKPYDQPYRELDLALGGALVKLYQPDPYATDLDKDLFYRGVTKLLDHKHGGGRGAGMQLIRNIPREDLLRMADKMVYIIEDKDKTYTFYNGAGRQDALEILYRLGIKEGMEYTVNTAKQGRGGQQRARMRLLKTFGGEAKYLIPRIREVLGKGADTVVKSIEESRTTRRMISLEEAKALGGTR